MRHFSFDILCHPLVSYARLLVLVGSVSALLAACETVVDPTGLPYVERIIVRGVITTGTPIDSILLSRTLPLNEEYTPEKAAITDATVTIQSGGKVYTLVPIGEGYYGNHDLITQAGEEYILNVDWHGKHVTGSTIAPVPVPIDSVVMVAGADPIVGDSLVRARFLPYGDQVYALTLQQVYYTIVPGDTVRVRSTFEDGIWGSDRIARRRDAEADGTIQLQIDYSIRTFEGPSSSNLPDTILVALHSYDAPFYDYYQTYHGGSKDNGPFSTGGETVAWNVSGDGIGMFIGTAVTSRRVRP